ncbi:phospholipid phosphatase 1-like [Cimex lectularius]|uniref:Phosphatidic acid phosphatase type 2/haloperoxidase domain-containing protein n=1 Tax=Cimex lectularius TaxID=79782 RepID=A0A8I6RPV1_CIMLE|nr:phospholipid phosphatase 1-like [Cimex lectularius]
MDDDTEQFPSASRLCDCFKNCIIGLLKKCGLVNYDIKRLVLLKVILQIFLEAVSVVLAFLLSTFIYGMFDPVEREIVCDDFSIKYPIVGKKGRYDYLQMCFLFIMLPAVIISIIDLIHYGSSGSFYGPQTCLTKMYNTEIIFLFGMFAAQALICIVQICSGRMRPDFLEVCKPDMGKHCTSANSSFFSFQPVCLGRKEDVKLARLSFPSEHSVMSIQSMCFLCLYMEQKITYRETILFKRLVQLLLMELAVWASFSEVRFYRNHKSDVYVGMTIGGIFGWLMDYFNRKTSPVTVYIDDL